MCLTIFNVPAQLFSGNFKFVFMEPGAGNRTIEESQNISSFQSCYRLMEKAQPLRGSLGLWNTQDKMSFIFL